MPPRRSHKKSRLGCKRCKARKIKCDEIRPVCGGCSKHGVPCDFDESQAHSISVKQPSQNETLVKYAPPSPSSKSSAPSPHFSSSSEDSFSINTISVSPATSRFLELRLMHNYAAATAYTLTAGESAVVIHTWQVSLPTLAMNSPCLMDAILAVSALHLRTMNPGDQVFVRASHAYMASSISEYSSALSRGVNESNAEALFATSALIAFQASASRIFMAEGEYTPPLPWFHSYQGCKTIVLAGWRWLRESTAVGPMITQQPALSLNFATNAHKYFGHLLNGLDCILKAEKSHLRAATKQAYTHSVTYLSWAHEKPNRRRILGFPATVSKRFVELIEQKAPLALVIVATFFAMTKALERDWWLAGIAELEVDGLYGLVPQEYRPMIEWAVIVAHARTPISDEIWGASWYSKRGKSEEADSSAYDEMDMLTRFKNTSVS